MSMPAVMAGSVCSTSGRSAVRMEQKASFFQHQAKTASMHAIFTSRRHLMSTASIRCQAVSTQVPQKYQRQSIRNTYPEPETEKERLSVDFPQEWMTPQPSRRPDVQPEFEKLETPMPRKLPGDPDVPDEEEEEEEEKKKKNPDKDDPEKEKPDSPPEQE